MWAHVYPFIKEKEKMLAMKPGQKVNKFPGLGLITSKSILSTSGVKNIPKAFKIPAEKEKFLEFAKEHPEKMFLKKNNGHRGVKILKPENLETAIEKQGSFLVQEFIHNPLLVDGYKLMDIGIYTTVTSVDPLRIYVHNNEVALRFCPTKYHPFDPEITKKYAVGDDYLPSWEVPSFKKYMNGKTGFGRRDTLNAYIINELNRDPDPMWEEIYSTIIAVYLNKEKQISDLVRKFPHKDAFFEMVRFDILVDEELNVHLIEANMSPNLSTHHLSANAGMYREVIDALLRLVGAIGVGQHGQLDTVQEKDVLVSPELCSQECPCSQEKCQLCRQCLSTEELGTMKNAFMERRNQGQMLRIFPPPVKRSDLTLESNMMERMSPANRKMTRWYREKCKMDRVWCDE